MNRIEKSIKKTHNTPRHFEINSFRDKYDLKLLSILVGALIDVSISKRSEKGKLFLIERNMRISQLNSLHADNLVVSYNRFFGLDYIKTLLKKYFSLLND